MKTIKHEFLFLKGLFKGEKSLKSLRRGWKKDYLIRATGLYLMLEFILIIVFFLPIAYFFESYFDSFDIGLESKSEILIFGILVAPFIEELIFRWPLVYNEKHLKLFLFGVSFLMLIPLWQLGLPCLILSIFLSVKDWDQFTRINPKELHAKYAKQIFWLSVIVFGLFHMSNYNYETIPIYLFPFMVIPQLIGGLSLGIIRVRFGLRYAIVNHMLWNLLVFMPLLFME